MSFSSFQKVSSLYRTTLAQGIDSNSTTVQFADTLPASLQYPARFVIEPNSSNYEVIYAPSAPTGTTFSGVTRGLDPGADSDATNASFKKGHPANVEVVLAPVHREWNQLVDVMDGTNGTGAAVFRIGKDIDEDIYLYANNADVNKPFVRYDSATNKWLISNDGSTTYDPSLGGSGLVRGLGIDIQASSILLDVRSNGGLRNNQGTGSQQADVDPTIVARLDTANTWTAVQTLTADRLQVTTDPDSDSDAVRKSYVDTAAYYTAVAGETIAANDLIGGKVLSTGDTLGSSTTGTSVNWSNPNNVFGAGNATNTINPTAVLRVIGFNFAVPGTATILGVEVKANISGASGASDNSIRLVKAGTPSGTAKTLGGLNTSLEDKLWGSRFDLWGNTLTPTDVNNASFGVDLNFNNGSALVTVNSVWVNVYYTDDRVYKSSANDVNGFLVSGVAKTGGNAGDTIIVSKIGALITGSGLVPGRPVYLSNTAGAISQTAGAREVIVGKAVTTTTWLFEGKKSFISGSLTIIQTQLVHRQINFGFKPRQISVFGEPGSNASIVSYSSRAGFMQAGSIGSPPYSDASATLGWAGFNAVGGTSHTGTITITDDGFLAVPSTASSQGTIYYEAYD